MILNKVISAGNFVYCMNYFPAYTNITMPNFDSGTGGYHQMYYMIDGYATVDARESQDMNAPIVYTIDVAKGQLVDATPTRNKYFTITLGDQSVAAMAFNPLSPDQVLSVEIVNTTEKFYVGAADKRKTLVCLQGSMTANGITITSGQHAKIFPGKSAEIVLNDNAICAIVQ